MTCFFCTLFKSMWIIIWKRPRLRCSCLLFAVLEFKQWAGPLGSVRHRSILTSQAEPLAPISRVQPSRLPHGSLHRGLFYLDRPGPWPLSTDSPGSQQESISGPLRGLKENLSGLTFLPTNFVLEQSLWNFSLKHIQCGTWVVGGFCMKYMSWNKMEIYLWGFEKESCIYVKSGSCAHAAAECAMFTSLCTEKEKRMHWLPCERQTWKGPPRVL